jgi:DNA adenine methylase
LLSKEPSPLEVYNDLDEGIVTLFRVLRDPIKSRELKRQLELTPFSRTEWDYCRRNWKDCADDVEKARRVFVDLRQGRNGRRNSSWGRDGGKSGGHLSKNVHAYLSCVDSISPELCERLREVVFENKDALKVLTDHDSPETFGEVDPPYVQSTRGRGEYQHEMTDADHLKLVNLILNLKGMYILFGRPNAIYQPLEAMGWVRKDYERKQFAVHIVRSEANGLPSQRTTRIESAWLSPNLLAALGKSPPMMGKILDPPTISLLPSASRILITQNQSQEILRTSHCQSINRLAA